MDLFQYYFTPLGEDNNLEPEISRRCPWRLSFTQTLPEVEARAYQPLQRKTHWRKYARRHADWVWKTAVQWLVMAEYLKKKE